MYIQKISSISMIDSVSACCQGGVGFEFDSLSAILETVKWYLLLLYLARDTNSEIRWNVSSPGTVRTSKQR